MKRLFILSLVALGTICSTNAQQVVNYYSNDFDDGFYSHPFDVAKYIQISEGVEYEFSCPTEMVWNQSDERCDWAVNVEVEDSNVESCGYLYTNYTLETEVYYQWETSIGAKIAKNLGSVTFSGGGTRSLTYCDPCWAHSDGRHSCCYNHTGWSS
ncbi:chitin binding peritrophin-A domain-containing protein [Zhouia amylolytica]|uniref:Chitin-binding type-2 domain-containing protein n=1 Tax=Zhouia amylolytica AD3 TaxID=1286632 RepID=W2UQF5_9FLAO|nr:chitin binding peritrophin-A domain-containing protein [Zhouia amylolytica]ETN96380.1 hypothetical protein P278_07240 [Zhouia amylolytica AD3]